MKRLIQWYLDNYKTWKKFQKFPINLRLTKRWPSETYYKYPPDCAFEGRTVLNFGCGKTTYKYPRVTNVDVVPGEGIDLVVTDKNLPFEDNTFDLVLANHVLEHVPEWFTTFKEFARIVKPGGTVEVWIPPVSSDTAFTYRDHINRIGLNSFAGCYSMPSAGQNALAAHDFKELGDVVNMEIIRVAKRPIVTWWTMLAWPSLLDWMSTYLRNTISEENIMFRKKTNGTN